MAEKDKLSLAFEKFLLSSELRLEEQKKGLKKAHDNVMKDRLTFRIIQIAACLLGTSSYIVAVLVVNPLPAKLLIEMTLSFFTTTWFLNFLRDWQTDRAMDKEYKELMDKSLIDDVEKMEEETGKGLIDLDRLKSMRKLKN